MRKHLFALFVPFILATAVTTLAQEFTNRRDVFQDETLRQDFMLQGEYLAKADQMNSPLDIGVHLIADGDKKFRVVAYIGGLPGAGWKASDPRLFGTAEVNGEELSFNITKSQNAADEFALPASGKAKIVIARPQGRQRQNAQRQDGEMPRQRAFRGFPIKIEVAAQDKIPAIVLEKQYRQSPTLGEKAPEGATVLFDGTNLDQFNAGAKMNEPQTQRQGQRGNQNTLWSEASTKPFEKKPYKLHVEFMLSYMPKARDQGRSNSGVYLDERYECQVLDSFGLEGENNECGGFYQNSKPLVNMCFPPLTWQTYDFDFTPAKYEGDKKVANTRVTVKLNGVVIHDNIELPKETPGRAREEAKPLGLYLQGHGNKVQYRNIWLQYH